MGNTQSVEGTPAGHAGTTRHSTHHGTASGDSAPQGGISRRLSRRAKPTVTASPAIPSIQTVPVRNTRGPSTLHPPAVGPVDMLLPVVGSPLPDSALLNQAALNRYEGGAGRAMHMVIPETIPQTLPNQGGLAQMMAARKAAPGVVGKSPVPGIAQDGEPIVLGVEDSEQRKVVPTLIRWTELGSNVYVSGSFIDWQYKIKLHENDGMHGVVVDLPVGTHCMKFIVDGKWRCSSRFVIAPDDDGNLVNFFKVEDVIEEAEIEKEDNVEGLDPSAMSNSPPGEYGSAIPDLAKLARDASASRRNEPPLLPPHLNQVLLNSSEIRRDDPNVLPVPNHVVLNHLYACSIKDNVMAVSSTSRYRGKYLTTIYYKPVTPLS